MCFSDTKRPVYTLEPLSQINHESILATFVLTGPMVMWRAQYFHLDFCGDHHLDGRERGYSNVQLEPPLLILGIRYKL